MARVIWHGSSLESMAASVKNMPAEFLDAASDVISDVTSEGASQMRSYIESRGTGYNGHTGRVNEGHMLEGVAASEVSNTGRNASGEYGWGVNGGSVQPYYLYQENGFRHARSGNSVPPMHALLDSFVEMREKFVSRVSRLVK